MTLETVRGSEEELAQAGVEILTAAIAKILQQKEEAVIAIPGGRSVQPLWKLLPESGIPWNKVHVFMADERAVPVTHEDSNYKLAYDSFLKQLIGAGKLPQSNAHPFQLKEAEDKGSGSYYGKLKKLGGKADILILGAGEDGHVGALYPNHHSVKDESDGYIFMDDSPKPPPERVTMTRATMLRVSAAIVFFIGEGKREAYRRFREGDDITECPARIAKKLPDCHVLTDIK